MEAAQTATIETGRPFSGDWAGMLLETDNSVALTAARVSLGVVMFPHGAQKLFGWFGGFGFSGTMGFFTETLGLPWLIGFLVILIESVGAVALIAGAAGRLFAAGTGAVMLGAILTSHLPHGFFMNWYGNQGGEGFEFHLLALGLSIAVALAGSGSLSVDRVLTRVRSRA